MTQLELIRDHLKDRGTITTWESFERYGITRLAEYIRLLRKEGLNIKSNPTTKKNRYGHTVTFSTYSFKPELTLF